MQISSLSPDSGSLSAFEAQCLLLEDPRPHPAEEALVQLGHALTNEILDLVGETALEDFQPTIVEALIGAFHSAAQRIERDADRVRGSLSGLLRDFDGSEILDTEIQDAKVRGRPRSRRPRQRGEGSGASGLPSLCSVQDGFQFLRP